MKLFIVLVASLLLVSCDSSPLEEVRARKETLVCIASDINPGLRGPTTYDLRYVTPDEHYVIGLQCTEEQQKETKIGSTLEAVVIVITKKVK